MRPSLYGAAREFAHFFVTPMMDWIDARDLAC
jgi:hypothetical protein